MWHRLETTHTKEIICNYEKKNSSENKKIFSLQFNRHFVVATAKSHTKTAFATFCVISYVVSFNIKNWRSFTWQIKRTKYWFNRDIFWSIKIELINWFSSINWQQFLISSASWKIFSCSSFHFLATCVDVSRISLHKRETRV